MSLKVFYSSDALEDIADLKDWLEQHSPQKARKVLKALLEQCDLLAEMPYLGRAVTRWRIKQPLRYINVMKFYLIFYQIEPDVVYIVRVLDGRRDIEKLLKDL